MSNLHLCPTPRVLQTLFSSWWSVPAVIFLKSRFLYTPASYSCVFTTLGKSSIMSSAAYCSRKTLLVNGSFISASSHLNCALPQSGDNVDISTCNLSDCICNHPTTPSAPTPYCSPPTTCPVRCPSLSCLNS